MNEYFHPQSEMGFLWVPCTECEIPNYVSMGIDVYAAYKTAFYRTKTGAKWERNIFSRFNMKRVTDDYSLAALKKMFPHIYSNRYILSFFAKVYESDIAVRDFELIGFVNNHGVYVTDRKRGKYIGYNVYIMGVGNGLYHKLLYVHREQTNSLVPLAKQAAADYYRGNNL